MIWRLLERIGARGVTFIISVILARLLDPEAYGTVALITVFIAILQTFVDSGFGNALIQKRDADDLDFSSVFYFNVVICLLLYGFIFLLSPIIAAFYDDRNLISYIRVVGLVLIISGVKNIQQAYITRNFLFKRFFAATLTGTIAAGIIGIISAYLGLGVWALIIQMLVNTATDTLILWITVDWRPKRIFSILRLKELFGFGWKILVSQVVITFLAQLRQIVIGKIYSKEALAFYNHGDKLPGLVADNINTSIDSVLFPALSAEQDSMERVKSMTKRAVKISSFVMMPLLTGLAVCAKPLVALFLTEKWLPCVPYLRIFCAVYVFYPIHTANLNAMKARGYSGETLKVEVIKAFINMAFLLLTIKQGTLAIALGFFAASLLCMLVNAWPNRWIIDYRLSEQLLDVIPALALSMGMAAIIYLIGFWEFSLVLTLAVQIFAGAFFYIGMAKLLHMSSYEYLKNILLSYGKKRSVEGDEKL